MKKCLVVLLSSFSFLFCSCEQLGIVDPNAAELCLWIVPTRDTFIGWSNTGGDNDFNFSHLGTVDVQRGNGIRISLVDFGDLQLPEGAEITDARLELYYEGKNADGTSDELMIDWTRTRVPWVHNTATWNNLHQQVQNAGQEGQIKLRPQAWCTSGNIASFISDMAKKPGEFTGFIVDYNQPYGNAHKGFASNQHFSRLKGSQGIAPRLLVKVKLPAGSNFLPNEAIGNVRGWDLKSGTMYTQVTWSNSSNWPAAWNVAPDWH